MANLIRHLDELPAWFRLEKYEAAKDLDAGGWYQQLKLRRDLIDYFRHPGDVSEVLPLIRENPIVDLTSHPLLRVHFYDGFMHEHDKSNPFFSLGVRAATARDHYRIESLLHGEARKYARRFFDYHLNDCRSIEDLGEEWIDDFLKPVPEELEYQEWIDVPLNWVHDNIGSSVSTIVNLELPDDVLVEQFKLFLQEQRDELVQIDVKPQRMERLNFPNWCRHGVLPFLDLEIWAQETGVRIPVRVMADAIFPPGEGGEETISKSTRGKAYALIQLDFLRTLASIASAQKLEKNRA